MLRFIDIRGQGTESKFSFFNTTDMKFVEINDCQSWDSWEDFISSSFNNKNIDRFKVLCPYWVFGDKK